MRFGTISVILIIFVVLICPSFSFAWGAYTHTWICERANLSELDCTAADKQDVKSQHPKLSPVNHHCTNNDYRCNARIVADEFLTINTTESRGFAAHLYADSMVPVHWYSFNTSDCHAKLESLVDSKLKESEEVKYSLFGSEMDFSSWNVSMTCQLKNGDMIDLYVDNNYLDLTANYVASKMHSNYAPEESKDYNLTPIVCILIVVILLVLVLFIVVGLKNRKNNKK